MKLQTRKRIFYVFFLLFVVIGASVVLYAEGWRLSPTLQPEKAGGIYVRSFPANAEITLNGKPVQNQSAFLSSGTFISGLFPKTYTLQLTDAGYDAWSESPQVLPSLVTEMKYAVLIPDTGINVATSEGVGNFFEVSDNVVTANTSGTITWRGIVIGHGMIVSHSADLKTVIIRSGGGNAGVGVSGAGIATYSLYNFTSATSTNLSAILEKDGITPTPTLNIFIDPYNDTGIIVQTKREIMDIDAETHAVTAIETAPAGAMVESPIAMSPSVMAWARLSDDGVSSTSEIIIYDKFSGDTIDDSLVVPGAVKQLAWIKNGELGVLENNNSLYLYNVQSEQLTTLADDVKQFYPTTDGTAVAALEYNSLEIFSSNPQDYYRFNLPQGADVQGLIWYKDDTHLFVEYLNHVSFLDLADTALKNFTTVSQGTDASYDPQEDSLYIIDQGQTLLRFDFPQ